MEGTQELADEIFELPVRVGRPQHIGGLVDVVNSPIYATGVGRIQYGYKYRTEQQNRYGEDKHSGGSVFGSLKRWFGG